MAEKIPQKPEAENTPHEVNKWADKATAAVSVMEDEGWRDREYKRMKLMIAAITASVVGFIGFVVSGIVINNKLRPFDSELSSRERTDVLGRSGGGTGGLGAGFDSAGIRHAHYVDMITREKDKWPLATRLANIGGEGIITMGIGAISGALAGLVAWAFTPKKAVSKVLDTAHPSPQQVIMPAPSEAETNYANTENQMKEELQRRQQNRANTQQKDWQGRIETSEASRTPENSQPKL